MRNMGDYVYRVDVPKDDIPLSVYPLSIPETVGVAFRVIAGDYGNGDERKKLLKADGYSYKTVQQCVNELLKLFEKYGG